jgi:hypothetical protein
VSLDQRVKYYADKIGVEPEKLDQNFVLNVLACTAENAIINVQIVNHFENQISGKEVESFFVNFLKGVQYLYEKTEEMPIENFICSYGNEKLRVEEYENKLMLNIPLNFIKENIDLLRQGVLKKGDKTIDSETYLSLTGLSHAFYAFQEIKFGAKLDNFKGLEFNSLVNSALDFFEKNKLGKEYKPSHDFDKPKTKISYNLLDPIKKYLENDYAKN